MVESGKKQKKNKWTTLIIIDSQAVKNTCNASIESKGFCFYKSTISSFFSSSSFFLSCRFFPSGFTLSFFARSFIC
jgi:hypothetical protein